MGFLAESRKLLEPNPVDISNGLLLQMSHSLQHLERGRPLPAPEPVQLATFSASRSARCVNTLWLSSVALSLSVVLIAMLAVIAMLAKGYPMVYNATRPRSVRKYALLRQPRFDAPFKGRALHIINLLPSMLLLALLLFAIGLILRLASLDTVLAAIVGVITGGALLLYGLQRFSVLGLEEVQLADADGLLSTS